MNAQKILVIDDDSEYREELVNELRREMRDEVVGVGSGGEANALLQSDPQRFQFAVIDQFLDKEDGIDLTKRLFAANQDLLILVFTHVPSDDRQRVAKYRYDALSAGAFRYLERPEGIRDAPRQVIEFIRQMRQLRRLKTWIEQYYRDRERVPSLLKQLDIGVDIIDSSFKVWFMNNAFRRITGIGLNVLFLTPCCAWHGYTAFPCSNCLVERALSTKKPQQGLFLSPLPNRKQDGLFYLSVWSQPLTDEKDDLLLDNRGIPLAIMESVQDLTDSPQVREMRLEERLKLIATSLHDRPREKCYLATRAFDAVRIMLADSAAASRFIVRAAIADRASTPIGTAVEIPENYLAPAVRNIKDTNHGFYFPPLSRAAPGLPEKAFISWPILEDNRVVAVLEASGDYCEPGIVVMLRPYADQVLSALRDSRTAAGHFSIETQSKLAGIDAAVQSTASPEEALRLLVHETCQATGCSSGHIRFRERDKVLLLPLSGGPLSAYEPLAPQEYSLSDLHSWSVVCIRSGQEVIKDMVRDGQELAQRRQALSKDAQRFLDDNACAICLEPLIYESKCIGSICLQSNTDSFSEDAVWLAREMAKRLALALHDFLVERSARQRMKALQDETLDLVLHNINTPLGIIRLSLANVEAIVGQRPPCAPDVVGEINDIRAQLDRIGRVREAYLRQLRPWEPRLAECDVHELVQRKVEACRNAPVPTEITFQPALPQGRVVLDTLAVEVCLDVLIQNAVDVLAGWSGERRIGITLREAMPAERARTKSQGPTLALDVEDTGPGVPAKMHPDLFHIVRSQKSKGLGFGLAYCRHVAESVGGAVYFCGAHAPGTRFTLLLPYERNSAKSEKTR